MLTLHSQALSQNFLRRLLSHPQVYEDLVEGFSTYFGTKNEMFDKAKFETACGVDELGLIP